MRLHKAKLLSSMLLMGALAAPVGLQAQDHDRDDQARTERQARRDNDRRWNSNEEPYYRQWYGQRYNGREYREYNRMSKRDRDAYWKWRHQHGDGDHDRDDRRDKDHDRR